MDDKSPRIEPTSDAAVSNPTWINRNGGVILCGLGSISAIIYLIMARLSGRFGDLVPETQHPTLEFLVLSLFACLLYVFALHTALRLSRSLGGSLQIVAFAILFRVILWWSAPILELDIYRYLWDGRVASVGVSPYRFSPQQVLHSADSPDLPTDLKRLVSIRDSSETQKTILQRVQYPELTTVYPPVSQVVFWAAMLMTPMDRGLEIHLLKLKLWILASDLANIGCIAILLHRMGLAPGWLLAYSWCPLVLKEFANSGHIDSVAVCFTTMAILCGILARQYGKRAESNLVRSRIVQFCFWNAAAVLLSLAIGAKLYPVILSPLLFGSMYRDVGWRQTMFTALVFVMLTCLILTPMLTREVHVDQPFETLVIRHEPLTPLKSQTNSRISEATAPDGGLKVFLSGWEINDFLFLIVVENCRPKFQSSGNVEPWFVVIPDRWRERLVSNVSMLFRLSRSDVPFLVTRFFSLIVLTALVWYFASQSAKHDDDRVFLESAFCTLAWFWLLAPTQNPWYWTWTLPFVPFARNRAWLAMSGLVFVYYVRFWFNAHWPTGTTVTFGYNGAAFFDFVIIWFQYAPWFVWLLIEWRIQQKSHHKQETRLTESPQKSSRFTWPRIVMGAIVLALSMGLVWAVTDRAAVKSVGKTWSASDKISMAEIDHSTFDALLRRHVDSDGFVDYSAWRTSNADRDLLNEYLQQLGRASIMLPASQNERLAFWINAYNAVTLLGILDVYPTSSIRNHTARLVGFNFWDDLLLFVDDRTFSLNHIEHEILRTMGEPRIHFAIVCASIGCPRLRNEAYLPARVEEQLADNAVDFFSRPGNLRFERESRTLNLSSIVDWFGTDFGTTPAARLNYLAHFFPEDVQDALLENQPEIKFLDYDWTLNDQAVKAR